MVDRSQDCINLRLIDFSKGQSVHRGDSLPKGGEDGADVLNRSMSDTACNFCNFEDSTLGPFYEYEHWNLLLHFDKKRADTRQSAGMLTAKEHVERPEDASPEAWTELQQILGDAGKRLCEATGMTYTGQQIVGFNQGNMAGQTVFHTHVHILPVAEEDPEELKGRAGMGAAFEALRRERLG